MDIIELKKQMIKDGIKKDIDKIWDLDKNIEKMDENELLFYFNLSYDINTEIFYIRENIKKKNYKTNIMKNFEPFIDTENTMKDYISSDSFDGMNELEKILNDLDTFTNEEILNLFEIIKDITYYTERFY